MKAASCLGLYLVGSSVQCPGNSGIHDGMISPLPTPTKPHPMVQIRQEQMLPGKSGAKKEISTQEYQFS